MCKVVNSPLTQTNFWHCTAYLQIRGWRLSNRLRLGVLCWEVQIGMCRLPIRRRRFLWPGLDASRSSIRPPPRREDRSDQVQSHRWPRRSASGHRHWGTRRIGLDQRCKRPVARSITGCKIKSLLAKPRIHRTQILSQLLGPKYCFIPKPD